MALSIKKKTAATHKAARKKPPVKQKAPAGQTPPAPPQTKIELLITLLQRPAGATLQELMIATGWQRHSVHGTLSGGLKKRMGLPVTSLAEARGRVYRMANT